MNPAPSQSISALANKVALFRARHTDSWAFSAWAKADERNAQPESVIFKRE
jgi:hypothetical protein